MKLRSPGGAPPLFQPSPNPRHTFAITTLTPLYGGGVAAGEPDMALPVRAASIRGQLRFWWRLLKSHHPTDPIRDSAELFRQERALWGGMAENGEDHASKVRLRVSDVKNVSAAPCAGYVLQDQRYRSTPEFIAQAHAYALFPAKGELSQDRRYIEKSPASVILPGLSFTLRMECPEAQAPEVLETLRWWASFGGLGARTRRGLGAVRVECRPDTPDGAKTRLPPVTQEEAGRYGCELRSKPAGPDALKAWHNAVGALQHFRQGEGLGRNQGTQPNRPGRSRWPEPASIRAITGVHRIKADGTPFVPADAKQRLFPRAAFGLPIIFHFQQETGDRRPDPGDCELKPQNSDRMASPLIVKPMALDSGHYAPIALRLPCGHLEHLALQLRNSGEKAHNPHLPEDLPADAWRPQPAQTANIQPLRDQHASDALSAFLNYFTQG